MLLMNLLKEVIERNGSDLHLVAGSRPMLRITGVLTPVESDTAILEKDDDAKLFEPFLTDIQNEALRNRQDVHTSVVSENFVSEQYGEARRFRVCLFWDRNGLGASLRVIPWNIPTLSQLFDTETEAVFRNLINLRRGLIIVAGMVGSGKSTTTASMIDAIKMRCGIVCKIGNALGRAQ